MKKLIQLIHLIILLSALSSPFWIDWKIILAGYLIYILQKYIFKGCLLSFAEFGSDQGKPKNHFTPYYLKKIFHLNASEELISRKLDLILAPSIPIIAIIIQALFSYKPLIII
jgi:hypothetical protein